MQVFKQADTLQNSSDKKLLARVVFRVAGQIFCYEILPLILFCFPHRTALSTSSLLLLNLFIYLFMFTNNGSLLGAMMGGGKGDTPAPGATPKGQI